MGKIILSNTITALWHQFSPMVKTHEEDIFILLWDMEKSIREENNSSELDDESNNFDNFKEVLKLGSFPNEKPPLDVEIIHCINQRLKDIARFAQEVNKHNSRVVSIQTVDVKIRCIVNLIKLLANCSEAIKSSAQLQLDILTPIPLVKFIRLPFQHHNENYDWFLKQTLELLIPCYYSPFLLDNAERDLNLDEFSKYCIESDNPKYALSSEEKIHLFTLSFYSVVAFLPFENKGYLLERLIIFRRLAEDERISDVQLKKFILLLLDTVDTKPEHGLQNEQDCFEVIRHCYDYPVYFLQKTTIAHKCFWIGESLKIAEKIGGLDNLKKKLQQDHRFTEFILASMCAFSPKLHDDEGHIFYESISNDFEGSAWIEKILTESLRKSLRLLFDNSFPTDTETLYLQHVYPNLWNNVFGSNETPYFVTSKEYELLKLIGPSHCKAELFNLLWRKKYRITNASPTQMDDISSIAYSYVIEASKLIPIELRQCQFTMDDVSTFIRAISEKFSFQAMYSKCQLVEQWRERAMLASPAPFSLTTTLIFVRWTGWLLSNVFITTTASLNQPFLKKFATDIIGMILETATSEPYWSLLDFKQLILICIFNLPREFQLFFVEALKKEIGDNPASISQKYFSALDEIISMLKGDFSSVDTDSYCEILDSLFEKTSTDIETNYIFTFLMRIFESDLPAASKAQIEILVRKIAPDTTELLSSKYKLMLELDENKLKNWPEIEDAATDECFWVLGYEWKKPLLALDFMKPFKELCINLRRENGAIDRNTIQVYYEIVSTYPLVLQHSKSPIEAIQHLIVKITSVLQNELSGLISISYPIEPENIMYRSITNLVYLLQELHQLVPNTADFYAILSRVKLKEFTLQQLLGSNETSIAFDFFRQLLFLFANDPSDLLPVNSDQIEYYIEKLRIFCEKCENNHLSEKLCAHLFETMYFLLKPEARNCYLQALKDERLTIPQVQDDAAVAGSLPRRGGGAHNQQGLIRNVIQKIEQASPSLMLGLGDFQKCHTSLVEINSRLIYFSDNIGRIKAFKAREKGAFQNHLLSIVKYLSRHPTDFLDLQILIENSQDRDALLKNIRKSNLDNLCILFNAVLDTDLIIFSDKNNAEANADLEIILISVASLRLKECFLNWNSLPKTNQVFEDTMNFLFKKACIDELQVCVNFIDEMILGFEKSTLNGAKKLDLLMGKMSLLYDKLNKILSTHIISTDPIMAIHQRLSEMVDRIETVMRPLRAILEERLFQNEDKGEQENGIKNKGNGRPSKQSNKTDCSKTTVHHSPSEHASGSNAVMKKPQAAPSQASIESSKYSFFNQDYLRKNQLFLSKDIARKIKEKDTQTFSPYDLIAMAIVLLSKNYIWRNKKDYIIFLNYVHTVLPDDEEACFELQNNQILLEAASDDSKLLFPVVLDVFIFFWRQFRHFEPTTGQPILTPDIGNTNGPLSIMNR